MISYLISKKASLARASVIKRVFYCIKDVDVCRKEYFGKSALKRSRLFSENLVEDADHMQHQKAAIDSDIASVLLLES